MAENFYFRQNKCQIFFFFGLRILSRRQRWHQRRRYWFIMSVNVCVSRAKEAWRPAVDKATCCSTASCCWNVKQPKWMRASECQYPVVLYPGGAINTTSDTWGRKTGERGEKRKERGGGGKRQGRKTKWKPISRVAAMQSPLTTSPSVLPLSLLFLSISSSQDLFSFSLLFTRALSLLRCPVLSSPRSLFAALIGLSESVKKREMC